jgi:hypothetical protein
MPLYKNCGRWKNFDCIFGFSVKSYVRNTINLSWDKILLTGVIKRITYLSRKLYVLSVYGINDWGSVACRDTIFAFASEIG